LAGEFARPVLSWQLIRDVLIGRSDRSQNALRCAPQSHWAANVEIHGILIGIGTHGLAPGLARYFCRIVHAR
jgi:hypothetical protein